MNTLPHALSRFVLGCLLALFVSGCGARQPVVYYHLTPLAAEEHMPVAAARPERLALGIEPVLFPEALSRAQIAARLDHQSLKYDDLHRWSNPLAEDFAEVLRADLALHLANQATIAVFPWGSYFHPSHRLVLNVSRFDGQLGDEVVLAVRWTITDGSGKEALRDGQSTLRVKTAGNQYQDLVSAQSQAVAALAKEIATSIDGQ